jgi:hypothetical protein
VVRPVARVVVPFVLLLAPLVPAGARAQAPPVDEYPDDDPAALTDFYAPLAPNGTWVDDPTYGTIWVPSPSVVGADFTPYSTAGHWVQDDGDWVWISDYDWGWAPFHYGRWVTVEGRGWSWIPGRRYAGAWVSWEVDGGYGYVGWAPAPPEFVWVGAFPLAFEARIEPRFCVVRREEIFSPTVGLRVLPPERALALRGQMHVYAAGRPGFRAGPPVERLGYARDRVPRLEEADRARVARAREFAHPSTAVAAGARPPTHDGMTPFGSARRGGGEAHGAARSQEERPEVHGEARPEAHGEAQHPEGREPPHGQPRPVPRALPASRPGPEPRSAPAPHTGGGGHGKHR